MDKQKPVYAWYVVILLLILSILGWLDRQIITFLVEPIKTDLGITDTQFGLISGGAFALSYALMGLPIGRLADLKNRKNSMSLGVSIWGLMTALCGRAKDFSSLFMARVSVGILSTDKALSGNTPLTG